MDTYTRWDRIGTYLWSNLYRKLARAIVLAAIPFIITMILAIAFIDMTIKQLEYNQALKTQIYLNIRHAK